MVETLRAAPGRYPRRQEERDRWQPAGMRLGQRGLIRGRTAAGLGLVSLVLLSGTGLPSRARATETAANCDEAPACRERFSQAQQLAKEEQLEKSLAILQPLYAAYPDPRLTYPLARLLHRLKRQGDAIPLYQRYLDSGIEASPEVLTRARQFLREAQAEAELDRRVTSTPISSPSERLPPPAKTIKPWVWVVVGVAGLAAVGTAVGLGVYFGTGVATPDATVTYR